MADLSPRTLVMQSHHQARVNIVTKANHCRQAIILFVACYLL